VFRGAYSQDECVQSSHLKAPPEVPALPPQAIVVGNANPAAISQIKPANHLLIG
jgi:hypothetical protein